MLRIDFKFPKIDLKSKITLVVMFLTLFSLPAGIYLSQKTTIFQPRAASIPVNPSLGGDIEKPEDSPATPLQTFTCSQAEADTGSNRTECVTPNGCDGHRLSRYYNVNKDTGGYLCYWSNECYPIDPNCQTVDTTTTLNTSEELQKAIYQKYKVHFEPALFLKQGNERFLKWAWEFFNKIENENPNFFTLLHREYPVVFVKPTNKNYGYRAGDSIHFRPGFDNPEPPKGTGFGEAIYKHNLIHELGHVISNDGAKNFYREIVDVVNKEGYISAYAAGACSQRYPGDPSCPDDICIPRGLSSNLRSSEQIAEDFSDTIAYYLNPDSTEMQYALACPVARKPSDGNPARNVSVPNHLNFISNLLSNTQKYPDISSCKFTRGNSKSPILSNNLKYWLSEVAVKENIPVGVLASVAVHENAKLVANSDDSHPAFKNNYFYVLNGIAAPEDQNTNAIGLFQIATGQTPTSKGIADQCIYLVETIGGLENAANKIGKKVHGNTRQEQSNYYCVADLDERIRRLCQTDRVVKDDKPFYTPDKEYDHEYINLCNLQDNIAVGAEVLKFKIGSGSWDNDGNIRTAIDGYYGGCTYPGGNYCNEVVTDRRSCNPTQMVSAPTPTPVPTPSPTVYVNTITINWNPAGRGGSQIYGDFGGSQAKIQGIDSNRENICNGEAVVTNVHVNYANRGDFDAPIKIIGGDKLCGTSPVGAGEDTSVRNLRYTCLNNGRSVQLRWDPQQSYDLRMDADPDNPDDRWNGTCSSPKGDQCAGNILNGFDATINPNTKYRWWVHSLQSDKKTENPAVYGQDFTCAGPAIDLPYDLSSNCNNNVVTLTWKGNFSSYNIRVDADPDSTDPREIWNGSGSSPGGDNYLNNIPTNIYQFGAYKNKYNWWIHGVKDGRESDPVRSTVNCPNVNDQPEISARCVNNVGAIELNFHRGFSPYQLRVDANPDSWDGTCKSSDGDFCENRLLNSSYSFRYLPNTRYKIWYHGTLTGNQLTPALGNLTISCPS